MEEIKEVEQAPEWEKIRFSETAYALIRKYGQCSDMQLELMPNEAAIYGIPPNSYSELAVMGVLLHYLGIHPRQSE